MEALYAARQDSSGPKYYALVEFPYPSGQGLHVGHLRPYTALDVIARKRRMEGYNVLFPMGWDAFGLPTENYAIQTGIHPKDVTRTNIANFKKQLSMMGYSFDWGREIDTTDPNYYKWTQWIFLKLFEAGLAYKKETPINFCTSCKVGLANEEVVGGVCERCGGKVVRRTKNQWMLKITEYAERLITDLDMVNYPERVKASQLNWIGKSTGAQVSFSLANGQDSIDVFTTRPDTLYGASYMVLSPEHPLIEKYIGQISNASQVEAYQLEASKKSDFERSEVSDGKTGVRLEGFDAINPVSHETIPIFISDYVLMSYGTGAIMAVPGHDDRDYEFAKAFNLPIIEVVSGGNLEESAFTDTEKGVIVNSPLINGLSVDEAKAKMTAHLEDKGIGQAKVNYRLRDWVFSRQRYWGEPIPLVWCEACGWVPIPEAELPLLLPELSSFQPGEDGESPLHNLPEWFNTTCPKCGHPALRETDTMPQWAGSSWYFLRYTDPSNNESPASPKALDYWMNVDWYNGGMEHTTLHLLYSRFWHKFLFDIGVVPTPEPYDKRTSHGMILGPDNQKMSKSRGNVINPDDVVKAYGTDTLRTYVMFMGDFEKTAIWSEDGVRGAKRFLDRVWAASELVVAGNGYSKKLEANFHNTIKKVGDDCEVLKFNTAIATLMKLLNDIYEAKSLTQHDYKTFLALLSPFAPHLAEELWMDQGFKGYACESAWPQYDPDKTLGDDIEIPVQINGKLRDKVIVAKDATDEEVKLAVWESEAVIRALEGKTVTNEIYIGSKIYNIVAK